MGGRRRRSQGSNARAHYSTNGLPYPQRAYTGEIRYNSLAFKQNRTITEVFLFEIVFLGTSASAPSVHRGLSSQVVIHDEFRFLIDCGEGTQRQLLRSGLGFRRLNAVLLTHGHLDHILGLGGIVSRAWLSFCRSSSGSQWAW